MTTARAHERILMIALDAAEPELIERWMDEGRLPNLARLRDSGTYGRLASTADWLAGSIWPTFHSGTLPGDHALYHFVQWHRGRGTHLRPACEWLPQRVFWREAAHQGRRVIALDLPALFAPEPINGIEITGWCNTDLLAAPGAFPPGTLEWARRRFGHSLMPAEVYAPQNLRALLRLRDDLIRWTHRTRDLSLALMDREDWDLFLLCLTATHRGGHKLWDSTGTPGVPTNHHADRLAGALPSVYEACDEAVGRLLSAAGPVTALVFSLHGMGPNTSRIVLLPQMLERILNDKPSSSRSFGLLQRARSWVPASWRNQFKGRLPTRFQDRLTSFWREGHLDLRKTRAFPLVSDLQGYIRINLRGREPGGIVEPGTQYDQLCEEISSGLRSFVDSETGTSVVDEVARSDQLYPGEARTSDLPDLIVRWSTFPASEHRALVSPLHGWIDWPTPGRHPEGRNGNHRREGFLLAAGEGIGRDVPLDGAHIVDLAPTVFSLLGLSPLPGWTGEVLQIGSRP